MAAISSYRVMGLVQYVLCAILLLCVLDTNCNFNEFIANLPAEFENVASIAWKGIVKAIKTPRLRKPKRNKKRKSTTTEITTELDIKLVTEVDIYPQTESYKMKLTIPILHQPEWKSMLHWRHLQRPNLIETAKTLEQKGNVKANGIFQYEGYSPKKQKAVEENDENDLGILYFIK